MFSIRAAMLAVALGVILPGTATAIAPYFVVSGNLVRINDGSAAPSTDNGTDLGPARTNGNGNPSQSDSVFRISNDTGLTVTITGAPYMSGPEAAEFTPSLEMTSTVLELLPGQQVFMNVNFNPESAGVRSATVHIPNDGVEPDFDFAVQGTGTTGQPNHDPDFVGQIIKLPKVKCKTKDLVTICKFSGQVVVFNGNGDTTAPQALRLHLSTDAYFDGGDEFLADVPALKAIAPGKFKKVKYKLYLPPTPSGKNLIVTIDPNNAIPERFEHNNRVLTPIP